MSLLEQYLTNGALFIDNSGLELMTTCDRAFEYSQVLRRVTATPRSALSFGGAIHKALEYRYKTDPNLLEINTRPQMLSEFIGAYNVEVPDDEYRTVDFGNSIINMYNEHYGREPFSVLQHNGAPVVEMPFSLLLGEVDSIPVFYTGRIDLVVERNGGAWPMDHKTSSIMGDQFYAEMATSAQHRGYSWAFWRFFKRLPVGYLINAIATRRPTKTGKGIEFNRQEVYLSEAELLEWEYNTMQLVEELVWKLKRGYMPMKRKWCIAKYGRCPYYDVCLLPQEQRGVMLSSGLFQNNEWSPLNKS